MITAKSAHLLSAAIEQCLSAPSHRGLFFVARWKQCFELVRDAQHDIRARGGTMGGHATNMLKFPNGSTLSFGCLEGRRSGETYDVTEKFIGHEYSFVEFGTNVTAEVEAALRSRVRIQVKQEPIYEIRLRVEQVVRVQASSEEAALAQVRRDWVQQRVVSQTEPEVMEVHTID